MASQSIQNLSGKNFADLLRILKSEAKFAYNHGSIVSSISCAAYSNAPFGIEINAIVIYSEGDLEQDFRHLSAKSLQDLKYNIDSLATQMALIGYEITAITHAVIHTSRLHNTFEAIMIFTKSK